jgi:hypothetical protein
MQARLMPRSSLASKARSQHGQALLLLVGVMLAVVVGALVVGSIARGLETRASHGSAADLGALAGAKAMRDVYPRLFEPAMVDGARNPWHLERGEYLAIGERAARETAQRNGAREVRVSFPGADPIAPLRIRVDVGDPVVVRGGGEVPAPVFAEAQLSPPGADLAIGGGEGQYAGPFGRRTTGCPAPRGSVHSEC